jgi:carbon storage regulator
VLVIGRRPGQAVRIGDDIEVTVVEAGPGRVKLGISAPTMLPILRKEIWLTGEENLRAARGLAGGGLARWLAHLHEDTGGRGMTRVPHPAKSCRGESP